MYKIKEILKYFQSPKYAPPIEFVDPAALSPPEGYKDGGSLSNALGGALGGHVFGAQHMQQLQVIQRLQAQRAAMLAARASNGQPGQTTQHVNNSGPIVDSNQSAVCTECAECAECAAKQLQDEGEFESRFCNKCKVSRSMNKDILALALVKAFIYRSNFICVVWLCKHVSTKN